MRILVTGDKGYIGARDGADARARGTHRRRPGQRLVRALGVWRAFGAVPSRKVDLRDVKSSDLEGFDAIIHLAGLSNDPSRRPESRSNL